MTVVLAHGAGALSGLPLPRWQFGWGIAVLIVLAFLAVGSMWRRPVLASAAAGRDLGAVAGRVSGLLGVVAGLVGVVTYVVIVTAGLCGTEFPAANIAPIGVFITFWLGVAFLSIVVGDVWRALSPFAALAAAGAWLRSRGRPAPESEVDGATHWPAVAAVSGFVWLELAYHAPTTPRILGWLGLGYGLVVLAGAARWGRGWLRTGEGFGVLFSLLAALAPLHRVDGRLRLRWPVAGLGRLEARAGTLPLLFVVLGAGVFDGVTRTRFWFDLTIERLGWGFTLVNTLGLAWSVGIVALVYLGVTRLVAALTDGDPDETARHHAAVLVPIVAAFTVAHYFSVLVLEGQGFWFLVSDPYGEGWDLFGTGASTVDFNLVGPGAIAWVQAVAVALGHVAAVVVAHDRAISDLPPRAALRAQYVLLGMIVASSSTAVALLLGT